MGVPGQFAVSELFNLEIPGFKRFCTGENSGMMRKSAHSAYR